MKKIIINKGLFSFFNKKVSSKKQEGLDLSKYIQNVLIQNNVPFVDPCCPVNTEVLPTRINGNTLQYFNGTDWVAFNPVLEGHGNAVAKNATGAVTASELASGYITSTSAAATTLTLPTATSLVALTGAVPGSILQFSVNNSGGASTVTLDLTGSGLSTGTSPITGGNTLTISVVNGVGVFDIIFLSGTTGLIRRLV